MKTLGFFLVLTFCLISANVVQAQIFSQDFSSSTDVADYVSATPNNGQFNAISTSGAGTTVSINGGTLQYVRNGANAGSFSRTTDFSPTPTSLIYKFDINVSGNSIAQTSAATFQVGTNFGTANSTESNANTYARFTINLSATAGCFSIRDITNGTSSAEFCGTQSITWVLNNSGATLTYTAPDGSSQTIANDTADIYIGNTLVFDDIAVQTPTQDITDLKFVFNAGSGTIRLDNFLIDTIPSTVTAANATVGGRITDSRGRGLQRVVVMMTGSGIEEPIYATTSAFGYYRFEDIPAGNTYILTASSIRYTFEQATIVINVGGDFSGADFIGQNRFIKLTDLKSVTKLK